ncbi:ParB/RepB/Spo0J family partition protein [Desulfurella multipotens]|uniref:ParB/RepB/Spo0J family partition protein n=1 Tax=Desulfurella TaxID=33001 RepID=UPI000CA6AE3B|nr:ParB/RepB/Spo0J family partition protein [Desulfurella multipotens]PMP68268.1 MAG: stage 0 sporulation protein J [Desulfurella multipotens]
MAEKKALGKGLSAIFSDFKEDSENIENIAIDDIKPSPYQPRNFESDDSLLELVNSIKEKGVIQPIIIRKKEDSYELIAGERRLRASKLAGLQTIPAIIKNFSDEEAAQIALIENIQREDLSPLDEALAYKKLIENFNYTQEELADKLGKNRTTITNTLRLLNLPEEIIELIKTNKITAGHARALLSLDNELFQIEIAKLIVEKKLNVRDTEAKVREKKSQMDFSKYENFLKEWLDAPIKIKFTGKKGKIEITFHSKEELEHLIEKFSKT